MERLSTGDELQVVTRYLKKAKLFVSIVLPLLA